ncbi:hypothetical protein BD410DRAFT_780433 [Rickenella mellea]|uniref:Uncharacterized protein n=1 Tax=Rickenella mellea TaxID=50990 RepID=A0A4R5XH17_9AGAM|nr:hypothetical protein BD410DRAFT_780433 [Rickenella mellea]
MNIARLTFYSSTRRLSGGRLLVHPSSAQFLSGSSATNAEEKTKKESASPNGSLDQGHVRETPQKGKTPQESAVQGGYASRRSGEDQPHDAASSKRNAQPSSASSGGNPEGVGFAEQVGGQSASADGPGTSRKPEKDEEAQSPGLFSSVKKALGLGTTSGDVKQNRGEGRGVTGTGTFGKGREMHTSAFLGAEKDKHGNKPTADAVVDEVDDIESEESGSVPPEKAGKSRGPGVSDNAHSPTGKWRQAGVGSEEYRTVDKEGEAYDPPASGKKDEKLGYGGVKNSSGSKGKPS